MIMGMCTRDLVGKEDVGDRLSDLSYFTRGAVEARVGVKACAVMEDRLKQGN